MSRRIPESKTGEEACGSKAEAYMFGFKNVTERETNFFNRLGCFSCPRDSAAGFKFCSREHLETGAVQR